MENVTYAVKLQTRMVKETDFPYNQEKLDCTNSILNFVNNLQNADVEKLLILHLNQQNELNCVQVIQGTINYAISYPREIIKQGIISCSVAMILVHNHPSGDVKPSKEDAALTKLIYDIAKQLGIAVHDHLILGFGGKFISFREEGMMPY